MQAAAAPCVRLRLPALLPARAHVAQLRQPAVERVDVRMSDLALEIAQQIIRLFHAGPRESDHDRQHIAMRSALPAFQRGRGQLRGKPQPADVGNLPEIRRIGFTGAGAHAFEDFAARGIEVAGIRA